MNINTNLHDLNYEKNVLPIDPKEVATHLRLDKDYDEKQLIAEITRATAKLEAQNCYALTHKTIEFRHNNPTLALPFGPVQEIQSVGKFAGDIPESQYSRIIRGRDDCIAISKDALSQKELESCGLAESPKKTYYKEWHMEFAVTYTAGRSVADEIDYQKLTQGAYYISNKIPPIFKNHLLEMLEEQILYTHTNTTNHNAKSSSNSYPANSGEFHAFITS